MLASFAMAAVLAVVPAAPQLPREIWVFRSVLDNHARVATVALHSDMWLAYDATNCGLFKVWNGDVNFDGAVYTTRHGPQPTSVGAAYMKGDPDAPAWFITTKQSDTPVRPRFRGYELRGGQVRFQFDFTVNGRTVSVFETPEYRSVDDRTVELVREFEVTGKPADVVLRPILLRPAEEAAYMASVGLTKLGNRFVPGAAPAQFRLVHRFEKVPGGSLSGSPSPASGGGGLGGGQTDGSPSPNPLPSEARAGASSADNEPQAAQLPANREPGLAMRVYWVNKDMTKIPSLVPGQTANVNKVIPVIDLRTKQDWGGFEDKFLAHITGFLNISTPGRYQFRLSSDDGSRFSIRDEVIIDHDGLHGETPAEGSFTLAAGEHPVFIEYFEQGADNVLRLEWKKPGDAAWSVIPREAWSTLEGEVRVTAPGEKAIMDPLDLRRPGDGRPLAGVHPSYTLTTVRPRDFRPRVGGIDFLPDGRMVVCNWEADGGVYVLDGVLGSAANPTVKRIAWGLAEPLGIQVVDGQIYVLQKQELTRLDDLNGDGIIDRYYCVANGWGVTSNFHEFAFGLVYRDGYFYGNLAVAIDPGGASTKNQNKDRGKTIKIAKNGTFEFIAEGLRTPNGIGLGMGKEIFVTDNQGDWLPSSKLVHVEPGDYFGSQAVDPERTSKLKEKPPVVWLPQGEIGNSPSEPIGILAGPYKGQLLHGDVTHGGVKRVFVERVNGEFQGVVFRFTQGLEAGVNRIRWGPDGALYIGGIGSTGNWGQEGKERYGLQKIAYNGSPTFEMLAVRAKTNGMEVELTEPLAAGQGENPADYEIRQWRYVPTAAYGGPKVDPGRLAVKSVTVSRDRKRLFLELPEMKAGHVVYLRLDPTLVSQAGRFLWSTEAWYTLNAIPRGQTVRPNPVAIPAINTLSDQERREGWRLLFDGATTRGWKGFRRDQMPTVWRVENGELACVPGGTRGDIATTEDFANFDLLFDWKVSPGGNSGVFYRASEDRGSAWETGPEFQLLDNATHPDGKSPLTSAGSVYAMYPGIAEAVRPAGMWNRSRIQVNGQKVTHWMNGVKVAEVQLGSPDWEAKLKASKFSNLPGFAKNATGRIVLQDHGQEVRFRSIKIRPLG